MTYTIPWDSYLIRSGVWTYPQGGVVGFSIFSIPLEEVFFFVIQTYITSLLYILVNKPTLYVIHLFDDTDPKRAQAGYLRSRKRFGQGFFGCFTLSAYYFHSLPQAKGTYIALICGWAGPVLLALWSLAYQPLTTLPRSKTWLPILLPTAYLWVVDTIALLRGTWAIESRTKLGIQLWPGLEVEEALFFLVTNTLIVFGLTAFENALAVVEAFPSIFKVAPALPDPGLLIRALFLSPARYDRARIIGIRAALANLSAKSRSFYLASSVFSGRLRIDLVLLYAFCRVGDDLVDDAKSADEAEQWIGRLDRFLTLAYSSDPSPPKLDEALAPFAPNSRAILSLLPTKYLSSKPLFSLLDGFRSDAQFFRLEGNKGKVEKGDFPIKTASDVALYASRVASTVASLCIELVYHHDPKRDPSSNSNAPKDIRDAGANMGIALQYTNIARDVLVDAQDGRCYLPTTWLQESKLTPKEVIDAGGKIRGANDVRRRLLDYAFSIYLQNRAAIEELPIYARAGIRVAVESYMEIGRVLVEKMADGKPVDRISGSGRPNRASVPKARRLLVGWGALNGRRRSLTPEQQAR